MINFNRKGIRTMKLETYTKLNDTKAAKARLQSLINRAELSVTFVDWLLDYAAKNQGKQLNKRLANAFKDAFPQYTVYYDATSYGQKYLEIWGADIGPSTNKFHMFLGYNSDLTIEPDKLKERLKAWYLDRERLVKYREAMQHVSKWARKAKKLHADLVALEQELDDYECGLILNPKYN